MLLDTSGLFSLCSQADAFHDLAQTIYQQSRKRLTTSYVLSEFVALAWARGLSRSDTLMLSEEMLSDDTIDIVWVDENLHSNALKLLKQRPDKSYSLCDAVSFVLMLERDFTNALTTDKHFEQEGFRRLLK